MGKEKNEWNRTAKSEKHKNDWKEGKFQYSERLEADAIKQRWKEMFLKNCTSKEPENFLKPSSSKEGKAGQFSL